MKMALRWQADGPPKLRFTSLFVVAYPNHTSDLRR